MNNGGPLPSPGPNGVLGARTEARQNTGATLSLSGPHGVIGARSDSPTPPFTENYKTVHHCSWIMSSPPSCTVSPQAEALKCLPPFSNAFPLP